MLAVLLATASSATAQAAPPSLFQIAATSLGLAVQSSQRPAASIVTDGLVDSTAAYSSSALVDGGSAESLAAAFYPGELIATGPALLCSNFLPCPVAPPDYPLVADASYPTHPSAAAPADGSSPAGSARASAAATQTAGTARTAAAAAAAPLPVSVGAGTSSTRGWVDDSGAHVAARSTLHDIVVGPLRVASLDAADLVDVSPTGAVHDRPTVVLSGVSFAGSAATIDASGVHVAGQSQQLPDQTFANHGLTVRLLGTSKQDAAGAARSAAGGLLLTFSVPVSGAPNTVPGLPSLNRVYAGSITIGGAGAAVAAGSFGATELPQVPPSAPGSVAARLSPVNPAGRLAVGSPTGPIGSVSRSAAPPVTAPVLAGHSSAPRPQLDLATLTLLLGLLSLVLLAFWRATSYLSWRPFRRRA